ncbi:DinB family protein [Nocardia otitidiscaviarum]|uniref:DinB family protein n=1 Tax=Nocardia otitidiscaviarum TaxID=1823 RepID=A0A516NGG7_9NOCA|nr:DinB family protein [Nocardia otitidiscaviarum]MCP9623389.1 DinB family protein [Nocardia otitidiscaviarum]QDP78003.1 DinB family protein [Nocardia otitidiscaviarum]
MSESRRDLLCWQFDLTWELFDYHLQRLRPDDHCWEPAPLCWTVRRDAAGEWIPDWADTEPDPIPVPTIAWLTWHIGWWWSTALDHAHGRTPRERSEITWPGPAAAVEWLRGLRSDWAELLDRADAADLDAPARFPWADDPEKTLAHTIAWVNAELMKNAAEIGQLRLLRAAAGT